MATVGAAPAVATATDPVGVSASAHGRVPMTPACARAIYCAIDRAISDPRSWPCA
jgi:hypothetical protein